MRPPHWALRFYAAKLARRSDRAQARPQAAQAALLAHLLRQFKDTEIGRLHDLASVRDAADFARRVPVTEEPFYRPLVERVKETNAPGLVTKAPLKYLARTSGTIAASKHVPFTPDLIRAFKRFETKVVLHTMRDLGDYSLLDGNLLITSGSPKVNTTPEGLTIGYGTGIMTALAPEMAQGLVRPTRPVLELTNWEAKIDATVREALPLDIRVMTGVPLFAKPILERLMAHAAELGRPVPNAQALWPHLRAYCYSGSPIGPHEARLRELLGPDVSFREIYTATESPVAYQYRHGVSGMLLDMEETYFEFQPAGSPLDAPRLGVHEVRAGVPYRLLMTTRGGLCAYRIGDLVEFISTAPLLIRHLGREHEEISLGFERLQLYQVRDALERASAAQGARLQDFFVGPTDPATGVRAYHWYVEFAESPADPNAVALEVDRILAAEHPIYGSTRGGTSVLEAPRLTVLPAGTIERYVLENRQFGQGKFTRLYSRREGVDAVLAAVGLS